MKIYLAARYSRREELCTYRADLEALGHTITSRWLFGNHQLTDEELRADGGAVEKRARFAVEDWQDLIAAATCISFTEEPRSGNSRGGRHVEFGAALALGQRCIVVGARENVFHCLLTVEWYPDWPAALTALREEENAHWLIQAATP